MLPNSDMNETRYVEMLEQKLDLHMHIYECNVFMRDGALCHRSIVACKLLRKHKIQVLEWPGNTPDLNPIENLWDTLKNEVASKQPSSIKHLQQVIKEPWVKDLTREYCSTLVDSILPCIQIIIDTCGGHTKY